MSDEKKLFFCGRAGCDSPGAWSQMMTEEKARDMVSVSLEQAGWPDDKPIKRFRVERHPGNDEDSRLYVWGEDMASFDADDTGFHVGTCVEIDGVVVYNDLKPHEDTTPEDHDEECDCKKHVPAKKPKKPKKGKSKK